MCIYPPILVEKFHKPHSQDLGFEPGKGQMFSGCLSQIPMLNLLLKDMEICRGTKPFRRC